MTTPSDERPLADDATQSSPGPIPARGPRRTPIPDAALASLLGVGQVVAGRYRIVRFVAHGGMGEVYEAEDLELHERVVLKRPPPEIAGSSRAIDRFKREIQLARRVTHPNVCRIFDIGFDDAAAFLTMELIEGETLAARIRREGKLSTEAALPIAEQMGTALTALHGAGIIHRDLKSQNVLLVGSGERVVVTDFGLARVSSGEQLADMASCTGALLGSPATMAPEQVEGKKVTAAADVYALGVVLFEMVTGKLPFTGPTPLATAFKRLQEDPPCPSTITLELDVCWRDTIACCFRRAPEDRFASAAEVSAALCGERTPEATARRAVAPVRQRRWLLGAAGALLLAAGGVALYRHAPAGVGGAGGEMQGRRRSVAVVGFKNLSGRVETAWLSTAFSEMLRTELAAADRVRLVPGESVARMKVDLSLADADSFASDTLERIQKNLDADYVVVGSYTALGKEAGGKIRFDVRVQETHAGELVASVSESGTETELLELVARTGRRLRDSLHAEPAPGAVDRAQASLPENAEVARLYSEGLARLRSFDAMGAKDLLERALAADPSCPMTHSALSQALGDLGYEQRAVEEAKRAFELAADLSREERLLVEARYNEAARDWTKAIATYRTLYEAFPDNLDYGLRLAAAQANMGKYTEATLTVTGLRRLAPPASEDPRIDLAEAWATPDYRVQEVAAARAAERGRARGARLLVAEAEVSLAMAYLYEAEPDPAMAAIQRGRSLYSEVGNDNGAVWSLAAEADLLASKGEIHAALLKNEEAAAAALKTGSKGRCAKSRFASAFLHAVLGELTTARASRDEAHRLLAEIHDEKCPDCHLGLDGMFLYLEGDLAGATSTFEKARDAARESENVNDVGVRLGELLLARGELGSARARFQEALSSYESKGVAMLTPAARLGIGVSYLEEGRPAKAEKLFREVLATAQKMQSKSYEAVAWAAVARAAAAARHDEAAQAALGHALALWPKVETLVGRVAVASSAMLVRGSAADRQLAETTLAETTRAGTVPYTFELRLALALKAHESANLAAIEKEATEKGFALVARKAAAARLPAAPVSAHPPEQTPLDEDDED